MEQYTKKKKNTGFISSTARCFVNVLDNYPREYWDYQNYSITWDSPDDFAVLKKIGRGKYSNVFLGVQLSTGKKVCIKTLIPVRQRKVQREIKILENLQGGPNIVKFLTKVQLGESKHVWKRGLVFEYVDNLPLSCWDAEFTDSDVRYYIYELLKALEWCHSKGIIHRDVKPQNVMIDHRRKRLALIDWGLAEFYRPEQQYNVRVSSRHFKGPELLVKYPVYDYSLDMWSLGCMLCGMVFGKSPFFHGRDNNDQLVKIAQVLGTDTFFVYLKKYRITLPQVLNEMIGPKTGIHYDKKNLSSFVQFANLRFVSREVLDFLELLLQYDHQFRPTASEAMIHKWFEPTRESEKNQSDQYAERESRKNEVDFYKPLTDDEINAIYGVKREPKTVRPVDNDNWDYASYWHTPEPESL